MDDADQTDRGVEFDDDLLADVPLDRGTAAKVVGGQRAEAKHKALLNNNRQEQSRKRAG